MFKRQIHFPKFGRKEKTIYSILGLSITLNLYQSTDFLKKQVESATTSVLHAHESAIELNPLSGLNLDNLFSEKANPDTLTQEPLALNEMSDDEKVSSAEVENSIKNYIQEEELSAQKNISDKVISNAEFTLTAPEKILDKSQILNDSENRIHDAFTIKENLMPRVSFWFDIYTKYGFHDRVIHHVEYPWIVFENVNIDERVALGKGPKWLRLVRAEKYVSQRRDYYRAILNKLAKLKNFKNLNADEKRVFDLMAEVKGSRSKVFAFAAGSIRSQTGQKDFYEKGLVAGSEFFPAMENIFAQKGLPTELTRLPLTESSFNILATSKVGASGIWQFMPGIGRRFMHVNDIVDERRSPLKSTELAAKLLKENYSILWKTWPLALTAYNHGPGGVKKAAAATKSKDIGVIVSQYRSKSFSFASSNFYPCFVAALHAEKYKEHLFPGLKLNAPKTFKEIRIASGGRAVDIMRKHGIDREHLLFYNPDLTDAVKKNARLPKGFRVMLPVENTVAIREAKSSVKESATEDRKL